MQFANALLEVLPVILLILAGIYLRKKQFIKPATVADLKSLVRYQPALRSIHLRNLILIKTSDLSSLENGGTWIAGITRIKHKNHVLQSSNSLLPANLAVFLTRRCSVG